MEPPVSSKQLRGLYEGDYVDRFPQEDTGRLRQVMSRIPRSTTDRILDVGCGNGLVVDLLHGGFEEYVGIDVSRRFVEAARRRATERGYRSVEFVQEEAVPFCERTAARFSKIFVFDVVEHINDDEFKRMFLALRSVLVDDGQLYVHTPNGAFVLEWMKEKGILRQFPEHIAVRHAGQYRRLFPEAGLRIVQIAMLPHYVRPLSALHALSRLPGIGRIFEARLLITAERDTAPALAPPTAVL